MAHHPILERYLWFDGQIRRGRCPNAADLARQFELCRKTAQRDIAFLRDRLDAPLEYNPARRGYRYSDNAFTFPLFTPRNASFWHFFWPVAFFKPAAAVLTAIWRPSPKHSWPPSRTDAFPDHAWIISFPPPGPATLPLQNPFSALFFPPSLRNAS